MSSPSHLKYASTHEWCLDNEDGTYSIGITDHAQDALGDIVFIELPELGQQVSANHNCAVVESVKAASDIYAPISGEVVAVNETLSSSPELVNEKPYDAWLFTIKASDPSEIASLLTSEAYAESIGE
jgi:glycine cleavage system H protein